MKPALKKLLPLWKMNAFIPAGEFRECVVDETTEKKMKKKSSLKRPWTFLGERVILLAPHFKKWPPFFNDPKTLNASMQFDPIVVFFFAFQRKS